MLLKALAKYRFKYIILYCRNIPIYNIPSQICKSEKGLVNDTKVFDSRYTTIWKKWIYCIPSSET